MQISGWNKEHLTTVVEALMHTGTFNHTSITCYSAQFGDPEH